MILVDTSIIIDLWRNPSEALKKVFIEERTAICGIVKAELIRGAKNEADLLAISNTLSSLEYIALDESIWDEVGKLGYRLRKNGITVPFQDTVLCALAIRYGLLLWSYDSHFALIKTVIEDLRLFNPQVSS